MYECICVCACLCVVQVKKINEISAQISTLPPLDRSEGKHHSGKELWDWLKPRLRKMVELERKWGDVHKLYPTSSSTSIFEDKPIPKWIRDPDGAFATNWDILQVFMLLYVSFMVPFRMSMEIEVGTSDFGFWFDVLVDIYFITDLVLCFRTAFWTSSGVLELDLKAIKWNYLKGW